MRQVTGMSEKQRIRALELRLARAEKTIKTLKAQTHWHTQQKQFVRYGALGEDIFENITHTHQGVKPLCDK